MIRVLALIFCLQCQILLSFAQENILSQKVTYPLSQEPVDVVIPCGGNDIEILNMCIAGVKQNVENLRRIIVVSPQPYSDQAEWFDESLYPFKKYDVAFQIFPDADIATYLSSKPTRLGWVYQQLLKLYAPLVIPGISENVLIVDADTLFLKPVRFLGPQGEGLYNPAVEYHAPYFDHAAKLLPGLKRVHTAYSGVAHHMLFQKAVIQDLFSLIEHYHRCEAWQAICRCIDQREFHGASMSEYEIYFNFALSRSDQMQIRPLKWSSIAFRDLAYFVQEGYDYVSCHYYLR